MLYVILIVIFIKLSWSLFLRQEKENWSFGIHFGKWSKTHRFRDTNRVKVVTGGNTKMIKKIHPKPWEGSIDP